MLLSLTKGISANAVPTFDVLAPFETGKFLATAGSASDAKAMQRDVASVLGITETKCRRDGEEHFWQVLRTAEDLGASPDFVKEYVLRLASFSTIGVERLHA